MIEQKSKGIITKQAYDQLIQICADAIPLEACGIVGSSHAIPSNLNSHSDIHSLPVIDIVIPIKNTHIDPTHAFSFDPAEWTNVYYKMQTNRQSLVGLFHSHPKTAAVPSVSDTSGFLPASNLSYWIVSLKNQNTPHVQPYFHKGGVFISLQLVLA